MTSIEYKRIMFQNNRFYNINSNWYPSVTSILKQLNEEGIEKWKQKIGKEQADIIIKNATERGTIIHLYCELYLKNNYSLKHINDNNENLLNYFNKTFINSLNKITNIKMIEETLINHTYQYAGTVDCIAEFNNTLSIIDFKTSEKPKLINYITSYFLQTTAYSLAYKEMTGILIEQIVIIIGIYSTMETQIFTENINNNCTLFNLSWKDTFLKLCKSFNNNCIFPNKSNNHSKLSSS